MIELANNVTYYQSEKKIASILDEVLTGLALPQKSLSPKFFYDQIGSELFDQICLLPEYYVTRTEVALLNTVIPELKPYIPAQYNLFELGSGSSDKVRALLDESPPEAYICIDISADHLQNAAESLGKDYPKIDVHALCIDYSEAWSVPLALKSPNRLAFFPGSSIGNFSPQDAETLLKQVAKLVGPSGWLLIGVDLEKSVKVLESAYNDKQGITEAFNKNALLNLNQLLGCSFDVDNFTHRAFYNDKEHRIEMHLVAQRAHSIELAGQRINFNKNESIHTENSYKYTLDSFANLAEKSGFEIQKQWVDESKLFSVHLCRATF